MLTADDTYEGYFLPKGTIVFANTWSIHRDQGEYERPQSFVPERFLDKTFGSHNLEELGPNDRRRVTYSFGAGRRVCPGQHLAENSLVCEFRRKSQNEAKLTQSSTDAKYGQVNLVLRHLCCRRGPRLGRGVVVYRWVCVFTQEIPSQYQTTEL